MLTEDRDLRPATFIRDIQEKSQMIEEEKANYRAGTIQSESFTALPNYDYGFLRSSSQMTPK